MAIIDNPILELAQRVEHVERKTTNISTKVDELYSLKQTVAQLTEQNQALNAFINEKFSEDFKGMYGVGYWYELKKERERHEEKLNQAKMQLVHAGYIVTKREGESLKAFNTTMNRSNET